MDKKTALMKAQSICSRQEKCAFDIQQKLHDWDISDDDAAKIVMQLVDEKFIDEERYTKAFVNDKFRFNKWGRIKISFQLKQKRISDTAIHNALNEIDPGQYLKVLENLLREKARGINEKDNEKAFGKLVSFAYNRGFSYDESSTIIRRLLQ